MAKLRLVPASGDPVEVTKDPLLVGRDPSCDLVVSDGSVSRKHARIETRGEDWAVVDQGSANGTFLDSQRVADTVLRHGQELRFGAVAYRVEVEVPEDLAATIAGLPGGGPPGATVITPTPLAPPPLPKPGAPPATGAMPVPPPPRRSAAPPPPPPPPPPGGGARPGMGSSPVAPMAGGPPPAKKGKSPAVWIGAGCCGCLVLLLLGVGVLFLLGAFGGSMAYFGTQGPVEAVRSTLSEIKAGQVDAAYQRLSPSLQSQLSAEAFGIFVAAHPALRDNADATFSSRQVVNDRAELPGAVLVATSGEREVVSFRLVKDGDDWKIDGVEFPEGSGPPTAEGQGSLQVETTDVNKKLEGDRVNVNIQVRATGFSLRPEGNAYRLDLTQDLETFAPDGSRIDSLSQRGFKRLNDLTASDRSAAANFATDLYLNAGAPGGRYRVRITINDLVGGGSRATESSFDMP